MHNRHTQEDSNEKRIKRAQTNTLPPRFPPITVLPLYGLLITEVGLLLYQLHPHHSVVRRQQNLVTENTIWPVIWIRRLWGVRLSIVILDGTN